MTSVPILPISRHYLPPAVFDFPPSPVKLGRRRLAAPLHAAADPDSEDIAGGDDEASPPADTEFDSRLAQVRLKYRSGSGKKAEQRRAKKSPGTAAKKSGGKGGAVMLPPISLREPTSAGGLKVDFGFTPYSEHVNGRLAALGLAALVLVELGSGKGLFSYHTPSVVFIQIYTVAAASALFVKFEKERISVWPTAAPPSRGNIGE